MVSQLPPPPVQTFFSGVVVAGQTPIVNASVAIYEAGSSGNGGGATALSSVLTTDGNGGFSVPSGFTCAVNSGIVYAVASGGQIAGVTNSATELVAVLGVCSSIIKGATFTVDEATTVAAAYALAQFFNGTASTLGATATNGSGITLAAATAVNLVDTIKGVAPGADFPSTGVAPTAKINSLANLLHGCIVSSGPQSAACEQLFTAAYGSTGKALNESAGETFGAVLSVAKNAGANVTELYSLSQDAMAYQPALVAAPDDWTLVASYGGAGMNAPSTLSIDSTGNVWVANYFNVASLFTNTGVPIFSSGITGNYLNNSYGGAVDASDQFWVANEENTDGVNEDLGSISVLKNTGSLTGRYVSGGINFPLAIAFDTCGKSWIVDYGDSSVTVLSDSGSPLSGGAGYSKNLEFPVAVATDAQCNAYVGNQSSNMVTQVSTDGSSFTDYVVGDGPSGLAVDRAGNIWTANYFGDSVGLISGGSVISGTGYVSEGMDHPQGIAADGAGTVWVASYRAPGLTELAGAATTAPGAVLCPSKGWAPDAGLSEAFALAIDASGNVWVSNFGSDTVSEFVGLAVPVKTPMIGPVQIP